MKKELAVVIVLLLVIPIIFAQTREDTPIFTDETPAGKDILGSFSLTSAQYSFNSQQGHVILRMGTRVREYDSTRALEEWSWIPGRVINPSPTNCCPYVLDSIDFNGDGSLNDVAYISNTKQVTVREGNFESNSDILWSQDFVDPVYSIRSTDFDNDGRVDDLIVASGRRLYAFKPATNSTHITFSIDVDPYIIAPAALDNDGIKNDFVVGTWVEVIGIDGDLEIQSGIATVYFNNGNRGWNFPSLPLSSKVTHLSSYDRDSDGSDDDILAIFSDFSDPEDPDSNLYIIQGGSQAFFRSNVEGVSPSDFDGDGKLDDFALMTKTQVFAFNSELTSINSLSNTNLNTTVDKKTPNQFLGLVSISMQADALGKNTFNDIAIFASISTVTGAQSRVIFFKNDFAVEEPEPSPTPPPTEPPNKPPVAKVTGISDGTTVLEGSSVLLSASTSSDEDGEIVSYQWLLDDLLVETGMDYTLNTVGLTTGSHKITLKVTDDDTVEGVTTLTFTIAKENIPPIADAGRDILVKEDELVSLSADGSTDPDGEITIYEWSEDGTVFSLEKNPEKIFSIGVHTVTLKITDDRGATASDSLTITVERENFPPLADAGGDVTVVEGTILGLTAEGSRDPDGQIISYLWSAEGDILSRNMNFNATFPPGIYIVTLNVTDDKGSVGTDQITVTVEKRPNIFVRIRNKYSSEIKVGLLTIVALTCAVVIYIRTYRTGLY